MGSWSGNGPYPRICFRPIFFIGRTVPLLKPPQSPVTLPNPVLSRLSGHSDPIVLENPLMLPFDRQVCYGCQICVRFNWILKIILEMAFSEHSRYIDLKFESNFYDNYLQSCQKMHLLLPPGSSMRDGPHIRVKLCSGAWKHGQSSHVGMFSLCLSQGYPIENKSSIPVNSVAQDFLEWLKIVKYLDNKQEMLSSQWYAFDIFFLTKVILSKTIQWANYHWLDGYFDVTRVVLATCCKPLSNQKCAGYWHSM